MNRRPQTVFALLVVSGYLLALFCIALFVVKPPLLGWLGFVIAGLVGLLIAGFAGSLFRRVSVNVEPALTARDSVHRVLVLADAGPFGDLPGQLGQGPMDVLVVAPVLASPLHFLTDDEDQEHEAAQDRLEQTLTCLRSARITARGTIGADDPLQAIGDALATFPANEIVVVTSERGHENWLEHGLHAEARQRFRIPVTCLRPEPRQAAALVGSSAPSHQA